VSSENEDHFLKSWDFVDVTKEADKTGDAAPSDKSLEGKT
jgi:hypothetical protein